MLLCLCACQPAMARDAREAGEWLCGKVFEAEGAVLAFTCDGFFALRVVPEKGAIQDMTGLWRLSADGVELTLFNRQDKRLLFSVGKEGLYGSIGTLGTLEFEPARVPEASFTITGRLDKNGTGARITDASSGYTFDVKAPPGAEAGKFATAEILLAAGITKEGQVLTHSQKVPRLYENEIPKSGLKIFNDEIVKRYWLLPPLAGFERAALRFDAPVGSGEEQSQGRFEISGRGLHLEGDYQAGDGRLTLRLSPAEKHNLKLLGAEELATLIHGEFAWRLLPQGLELSGSRKLLLLPNQS